MARGFQKKLASVLKKSIFPSSAGGKLRRSYSSESYCSSWSSSSTDLDSDIEEYAPSDVPQGCFAVYVEKRRFFVQMKHLNHPLFKALLERAAEEYGFDRAGALTIPCEAVFFEHVLWLLNNNDGQARSLEIEELISFYSSSSS